MIEPQAVRSIAAKPVAPVRISSDFGRDSKPSAAESVASTNATHSDQTTSGEINRGQARGACAHLQATSLKATMPLLRDPTLRKFQLTKELVGDWLIEFLTGVLETDETTEHETLKSLLTKGFEMLVALASAGNSQSKALEFEVTRGNHAEVDHFAAEVEDYDEHQDDVRIAIARIKRFIARKSEETAACAPSSSSALVEPTVGVPNGPPYSKTPKPVPTKALWTTVTRQQDSPRISSKPKLATSPKHAHQARLDGSQSSVMTEKCGRNAASNCQARTLQGSASEEGQVPSGIDDKRSPLKELMRSASSLHPARQQWDKSYSRGVRRKDPSSRRLPKYAVEGPGPPQLCRILATVGATRDTDARPYCAIGWTTRIDSRTG